LSAIYTFEALEKRLRLRVVPPELRGLAADLHSCIQIPALEAEGIPHLEWRDSREGKYAIWLRGEPWGEDFTPDQLFLQSENLLTQLFLTEFPEATQLHAAAVADGNGHAWLICGPSGAGKTSWTLTFILQGWRWISDEYVLIDRLGSNRVRGLPRNFNLKERSFPNFPETAKLPHARELYSPARGAKIRFIDPGEMASKSWIDQGEIRGMLFPQFEHQATEPALKPLSAVVAANLLLGEMALAQKWSPIWVANTLARVPAFCLSYSKPRVFPGLFNWDFPCARPLDPA
jgi:hypothetical protein